MAVCLYDIASFWGGLYDFIYLRLVLRSLLQRSNNDKSVIFAFTPFNKLIKVTDISSSLGKNNHDCDCDGIWISDLN